MQTTQDQGTNLCPRADVTVSLRTRCFKLLSLPNQVYYLSMYTLGKGGKTSQHSLKIDFLIIYFFPFKMVLNFVMRFKMLHRFTDDKTSTKKGSLEKHVTILEMILTDNNRFLKRKSLF